MRGEMNSYQLKFHFCQNDRYEIHTRIEFQTHMRIRCNIQRVCAYSFRFGKIMFTWKSHAGLKFDFGQIDRYEISYRFEFILPLIWTYSKSMCFHFFFTVQVDTVYQKVLYSSCFFLLLRHVIQKTK